MSVATVAAAEAKLWEAEMAAGAKAASGKAVAEITVAPSPNPDPSPNPNPNPTPNPHQVAAEIEAEMAAAARQAGTAGAELKGAMPWPWQTADPEKLRPAFERAKTLGAKADLLGEAEAKLKAAEKVTALLPSPHYTTQCTPTPTPTPAPTSPPPPPPLPPPLPLPLIRRLRTR